MQNINEFIYYDISINTNIKNSYCQSTQNDSYIFLTFGLCVAECLFDLAENNYLISIRINKSYFEKYNEHFEINIEKQNICCHTQMKLLELINFKTSDIYGKIFVESLVLFLIYQSQKNSILFKTGCDNCSLLKLPIDYKKMEETQRYIIENLELNLNIPDIAKAMFTNQCYLKKAFKETFNQTIFEFIQENRMTKAKFLVQNTSLSVTEIAEKVGYTSISSFSQAFKNYYGISPIELKNMIT